MCSTHTHSRSKSSKRAGPSKIRGGAAFSSGSGSATLDGPLKLPVRHPNKDGGSKKNLPPGPISSQPSKPTTFRRSTTLGKGDTHTPPEPTGDDKIDKLLLVVFQAAVNEDRIGKSRGSKQAQIAMERSFLQQLHKILFGRDIDHNALKRHDGRSKIIAEIRREFNTAVGEHGKGAIRPRYL